MGKLAAFLWGVMRRFKQGKPFDRLKVTVAANERCLYDEGGCGDPKVVLIQ